MLHVADCRYEKEDFQRVVRANFMKLKDADAAANGEHDASKPK
jgi:hypothetical protein